MMYILATDWANNYHDAYGREDASVPIIGDDGWFPTAQTKT